MIMKNISKKLTASVLVLAMMIGMLLPTITLATDEGDKAINTIDGTVEPIDPIELKDGELEDEDEKMKPTFENIKLNTKIVFSGDLYSTNTCRKVKKANLFGKELTGYEDQIALVVMKNLTGKNSIFVSFIDGDGKLRSGHIKIDQVSAVLEGKYVDLNFEIGKESNITIKVNGEKYKITSNTDVALLLGGDDSIYGIKVGEQVTLLNGEGNEIEIVSANGQVGLDIEGRNVTGEGDVAVYNKTVEVGGTATLKIIDKGVEVSGDASLNGKEIGGGAVQITTEGVEVTELSVASNEVETTGINKIIDTVLKTVKELISKIFEKLLGGSAATGIFSGVRSFIK